MPPVHTVQKIIEAATSNCSVTGVRGERSVCVRVRDDDDPCVELDVVRGERRTGRWSAALADSFGFGGHNAALVFTK
ncbi:hypothetical protein AB0L85_29340 [Streptomyces sp. NPDC052051]|uniref:hypothetical protein n=1 Tax=Streptomyces sp. NPDC052051 TaxID=3154649 RepID=UPI003449EE94